jgi:hypothetical protein
MPAWTALRIAPATQTLRTGFDSSIDDCFRLAVSWGTQAVIDGNRSGGQDREDRGCFLGRHWRLRNPASGDVVREGGA